MLENVFVMPGSKALDVWEEDSIQSVLEMWREERNELKVLNLESDNASDKGKEWNWNDLIFFIKPVFLESTLRLTFLRVTLRKKCTSQSSFQ